MNFNPALVAPELFLLLIILVLFVQSLWGPNTTNSLKWLPAAALVGFVVAALFLNCRGVMFWDAYKVDALSQFFKAAVAFGYCIAVWNAFRQPTLDEEKRSDYFLFLSLSAWGLMLLASSAELITIYVALELSSYSLYALVPLRSKEKSAAEAGIKYILFGAVATALALYGLSYILASQQTTYLSILATKSWAWADAPMAVVGLSLFLAGMFYKLALFPFHFWCPDVYEGASNETAAYIATLPKLGSVVVLIRLAAFLKPGLEITMILAVLGAASMTLGNVLALAQKDVKRILGYSSVAHAGFIMLGLVSGTAQGLAAAGYYSLIYILMNLTCFWVICRISSDGRNIQLDDLNGLYKRAPGLALVLAVSAFALVGLPPTAGFMAKFFLLTSAWNHGYDWLVIIAAINAALAIYYYLNFVRHAYTNEPAEGALETKSGGRIIAGLLAAGLVILGLIPSPLFELAMKAGKELLP